MIGTNFLSYGWLILFSWFNTYSRRHFNDVASINREICKWKSYLFIASGNFPKAVCCLLQGGISLMSNTLFVSSLIFWLLSKCSQVDPIVASFSGGAVGVISALMVVEINNVKQQEKKRCKYCLGTGMHFRSSHFKTTKS